MDDNIFLEDVYMPNIFCRCICCAGGSGLLPQMRGRASIINFSGLPGRAFSLNDNAPAGCLKSEADA